jgi:hypothetical protein
VPVIDSEGYFVPNVGKTRIWRDWAQLRYC